MNASHDHDSHDHAHHHGGDRREGKLLVAFALTTITLVVEAVGGWMSGSLALLADAGHMLVDALALLFAWLGAHFARKPADSRRSFGYGRLEILVGYSNSLIQFVLVAWIVLEALMRFSDPQPILSGMMFWVAVGGLSVNAFVLFVLSDHHHDDLNTASARLHVIGDLFGSVGAIGAALLIGQFGWLWADPLLSVLVSLLILRSAWRLMRRSGHILLEGTPEGIHADFVAEAIQAEVGSVRSVHHVHVWQLAGGYHVATLHARLLDGVDADAAIRAIRHVLDARFRIEHATIQIEREGCVDAHCRH